MDKSLAGKWICPMHGEVVKDSPGNCDICGMALIKAEELGYKAAQEPAEAPLVIPASAALLTGKELNRAVVYVRLAGEKPVFVGRQVTLGPRAGEFYIIKEGLMEGEDVVVNGNFKIDSAAQIQAKPSMMTTPDGAGTNEHQTH